VSRIRLISVYYKVNTGVTVAKPLLLLAGSWASVDWFGGVSDGPFYKHTV
jgi:hypothetical protein